MMPTVTREQYENSPAAAMAHRRANPPHRFTAISPADMAVATAHAFRLARSTCRPVTILQEDTAYLWFEYRAPNAAACRAPSFRPLVTILPPGWFS